MSEMTTVSMPKDLRDKLQALTPPGGKLSDAIASLVTEHENQRVIGEAVLKRRLDEARADTASAQWAQRLVGPLIDRATATEVR